MRFMFRLLAAVAAVALSVGAANAAPILLTNGTNGTSTLSTGSGMTLSNFGSAISNFVTAGPTIHPTNLAVTDTTFNFNGSGVLTAPVSFTITDPSNSVGGGTATFTVTSGNATLTGDTLMLTGLISLNSNTFGSSFDLSRYTSGGTFTLTFNGGLIAAVQPVDAPPSNLLLLGSSSFTLTPNATTTPEPASLAVFGVLALGGLAVARRKILAKRDAV